ncbi:hypothetical protein [Gemmatirosa kalamazoonensis]|uniref:hypothetical protein n=1 Tax=Gemmatirosa kalamazoonensis TaxID=861299 RepID=UPI00130EDFE0|nr:hypothetical protein [Gemmatirosa kalamazoonensis]
MRFVSGRASVGMVGRSSVGRSWEGPEPDYANLGRRQPRCKSLRPNDPDTDPTGPACLTLLAEWIVEPLLDGRCSGGIERLWEELSDEELYVFITAGFRRELILLNRAPDMQRARQVGAATPADLRTHVPLWDATTFRLEEAQRAVSAASRQRGGARNRRSR